MSQWRENVSPFSSEPEKVERLGGNQSRETSPAKQFMEEVLSDSKGGMGGWRFPVVLEKEETREVEVVGWDEIGETSRPEDEEFEFEFEFERTTTTSTSDLPRTSLGAEPSPTTFNRNIKDYSSTPNLSLILVDSNATSSSSRDEPSSLNSLASPISFLSPTSVYASPHSPTFPSTSSDDGGTRTPRPRQHQHKNLSPPPPPPSSAPAQQTSFARGRSPPSARSKLNRITTFFDRTPAKLVIPEPPRKGLGNSIVIMSPGEMSRRLREMEQEEDHDEESSKRMESFFM